MPHWFSYSGGKYNLRTAYALDTLLRVVDYGKGRQTTPCPYRVYSVVILSNCGAGEDSWESLDQQSILKEINPEYHWKDWFWSWSSNTLATWCEELTHWKRPWCWERLKSGGEGDERGWDGWVASLTQWTRVWVNSGSWWWTKRPGVLRFMGSQKVGHDWATELNWTELILLNHGFLQIYTQEWGCWIPLGFTIKDSFVLGNESLVGSSF